MSLSNHSIEYNIQVCVAKVLEALYGLHEEPENISIQPTRKEFEGHYTLVVFPYLKVSRSKPQATAEAIGLELKSENPILVKDYNVVNGFLNITLSDTFFAKQLVDDLEVKQFGTHEVTEKAPLFMVEYSSPNTNKPLHLGHVRNNLLGYSISKILAAAGNRVIKTNIVNDRGVHICKSMLAWKKWGNGITPASSCQKGDHLVGEFYVLFGTKLNEEITKIQEQDGISREEAEQKSQLMCEVRQMLKDWENGDQEVRKLWKTMNGWVYEGFDETYKNLGVSFDKIYYESDTYTVGREEVYRGLREGIFTQDQDGSIWADLTDEGYDRKLLLRADGTSVYITQDIGTAKMRYQDYPIDKMVYVVGNEQDYHFQVLSIILDKLGFDFGKDLKHFSYGMVSLPDGSKIKSREGTRVDADDLILKMTDQAYEVSSSLDKMTDMSDDERKEVARKVGLGALKYFLLKVDPKKNILFDPFETINFNGNTGPFIQYTYARISSVLRNAEQRGIHGLQDVSGSIKLEEKERTLIITLDAFPALVRSAAMDMNPAMIANYVYDLVKEFNQFYHDYSVLNEKDQTLKAMRVSICQLTARVIASALDLLGIEVPERM